MFDIEKELKALGAKKDRPDETLRQRTLDKLRGAPQAVGRLPALRWAIASAAAVVLAAVVLLAVLPGAQQTSYFTIDINPSIGIETNADGVILSVKAQNSDAETLLTSLDLTGMPFIDALRCVVQAAEEQGYLKDNGHVLVAHFGATAQITEEQIESAVSESTHKQVNVLLLESGRGDYQDAGQTHQSAGVSLLMRNAQRLGIEDADFETIIETVKKDNHSGNGNVPQNSRNAEPSAAETTEPGNSLGNGNENKPEKSNNGNNTNNGEHGNSANHSNNGQSDKEDKEKDD